MSSPPIVNTIILKAQQIWYGDSGVAPFFFNNDTVNTLYIGPQRDVLTGNISNCIPVPPLGGAAWPDSDWWAFATAPAGVNLLIIPGATAWAPSPVQVQIALNAAGLATSANQTSQITQETNTAGNTGTTATNTGNTVPPLLSLNGQHPSLNSHYPNPNFVAPGGAADISGWGASGGTLATAGELGSIALPAGSGESTGAYCTAPGTNTFLGIFPSVGIPCQPGQVPYLHYKMYATGAGVSTSTYFGQCAFQFYGASGFISSINVNVPLTGVSAWQKYFSQCPIPGAPAGTLYCVAAPALIVTAGNIPNTVTAYLTAIHAGILGQPGTHGGDHAVHHAQAGTPLNRLHNSLISVASTAITVGTPVNIPASPVPFTQIGYSLFLSAYVTAGAVNGFLQVNVIWLDKASGLAVDQQTYWIYAGTNAGAPHNIRITGPTEGNEVQVTLSAFGANITVANLLMFQSSVIYPRHFPLTTVFTTLPAGTPTAFNDPLAFILGKRSAAALGAGATDTSVIPLYSGRVWVQANTTALAANDLQLIINPFSDQGNAGNLNIINLECDGSGNINTYVTLPRAQCEVAIKNQGAGAQTLTYSIIAAPEG